MKGVSAFVSFVLLISVALGAGIIITNWYYPMVQSQSKFVEEQSQKKIECNYAGIKIKDDTITCNFTATGSGADLDRLNFTLENTGSINLYNFTAQIFVNSTAYSYRVYEGSTNNEFLSNYTLKPDERKTVYANITANLPSSDADWIRVIVSRCPQKSDEVKNIDCTP